MIEVGLFLSGFLHAGEADILVAAQAKRLDASEVQIWCYRPEGLLERYGLLSMLEG